MTQKKESSVSKQQKEVQTKSIGHAETASIGLYGYAESGISGLNSSLRQVRKKAFPQALAAQFGKAQRLAEEDDLISSIITTQIEFGNLGFDFVVKNSRAKKRFNPFIQNLQLHNINTQMWRSLCIFSNVVLHWKVTNTGKLEYVNVLNPYDLEVVPYINGQSLVYMRLPKIIEKLVNNSNSLSPEERKILASIPEKYKKAARGLNRSVLLSGDGRMVLLSNDDGEYWIIANQSGYWDRLISPSMKALFDSVENRNMLIDGDFSVSYAIKNLITHVTTGESITGGPLAGSDKHFADPDVLKSLRSKFQTTGKAVIICTDHTTKVQHVIPDIKVFDPMKYTSPESRILRWGGIGEIILLGQGGNYAAGFINLKRLAAKAKRTREIISSVWKEFFSHETVRGKDIGKNIIPEQIYDDSLLKEAGIALKETQMLIDRGGLSKQTALAKAGYNPEIEEQNKKEEIDKGELYQPTTTPLMPVSLMMEKKSSGKEKGEPGRERKEVTSHGEETLDVQENPKP